MDADPNLTRLHKAIASALSGFTEELAAVGCKPLYHSFALSIPRHDDDPSPSVTNTPVYYSQNDFRIDESSSSDKGCPTPSCAYHASQLPTVLSLHDRQLKLNCSVDLNRSASTCDRHKFPPSSSPPNKQDSGEVEVIFLTQQSGGAWWLHTSHDHSRHDGLEPAPPYESPAGDAQPDLPKVEPKLESIMRLYTKVVLKEELMLFDLPPIADFSYPFVIEESHNEGTIRKLKEWALTEDSSVPRFYWLNGSSGTGKTTVASIFEKWLSEGSHLVTSFFYAHRQLDHENVGNCVIPAIADGIAKISSPFRRALEAVLKDLDAGMRSSIGYQLIQLVVLPFKTIPPEDRASFSTKVVVLDGFDDCDDKYNIGRLLVALSTLNGEHGIPLKFFVTGRSDSSLKYYFDKEDTKNPSRAVTLSTHEQDTANNIEGYINSTLKRLVKDETKSASIKQVAKQAQAGCCFLYATAICEWITYTDTGMHARLGKAVSFHKNGPTVDALYHQILINAFDSCASTEKNTLRFALAIIVSVYEPLPLETLGIILHESAESVLQCLQFLYPLIITPLSDSTQVKMVLPIHDSFRTFLIDKSRPPNFSLDCADAHRRIAKECINVLLKYETSSDDAIRESLFGRPGRDHTNIRTETSIRAEYAARYWILHVSESTTFDISDADAFRKSVDDCFNSTVWTRILQYLPKFARHLIYSLTKLLDWALKINDDELKKKVQYIRSSLEKLWKEKPSPDKLESALEKHLLCICVPALTRMFCADLRSVVDENGVWSPPMLDPFKTSISKTIPNIRPVDKENPYTPPLPPQEGDLEVTRDNVSLDLSDIREILLEHDWAKDKEQEAKHAVIVRSTSQWEEPTNRCLDQIYTDLRVETKHLADKHFERYQIEIRHMINDQVLRVLRGWKAATKEKLIKGTLTRETKPGGVPTNNSRYLKQEEEKWRQRYINIYEEHTQPSGDNKTLKHDSDKELLLRVAASIRAYFQISFQRFIDYVPLTIEDDLLTALSKSELCDEILKEFERTEYGTSLSKVASES